MGTPGNSEDTLASLPPGVGVLRLAPLLLVHSAGLARAEARGLPLGSNWAAALCSEARTRVTLGNPAPGKTRPGERTELTRRGGGHAGGGGHVERRKGPRGGRKGPGGEKWGHTERDEVPRRESGQVGDTKVTGGRILDLPAPPSPGATPAKPRGAAHPPARGLCLSSLAVKGETTAGSGSVEGARQVRLRVGSAEAGCGLWEIPRGSRGM